MKYAGFEKRIAESLKLSRLPPVYQQIRSKKISDLEYERRKICLQR